MTTMTLLGIAVVTALITGIALGLYFDDDEVPFYLGMGMFVASFVLGYMWLHFFLMDQETSREPDKTVTVYNSDGSVLAWYDGDVDVERDGTSVTIKVDGKTFEYINNPVTVTYNEEKEG